MKPPNPRAEVLATLGASLTTNLIAFFQGPSGGKVPLFGDTQFESASLRVRVPQALVAITRAFAVVP